MTVLVACAAVLVVLFVATWAWSLVIDDVSIVDVLWGGAFAAVAWTALAVGTAPGPRPVLVAVAVTAWGLRLAGHLARRRRGEPEDRRYAALRDRHGDRFRRRSLPTVFGTQAALVLVVSLPIQAVNATAGHDRLGLLDGLGLALFVIGLTFETVGDAQLRRFRDDPDRGEAVLDTGLWRYTRHPNYFGDATVWVGLGLTGAAAGAWWSLIGPTVMVALLVAGTGKPLLERSLADRRPGYRDYVARTSGFVPWPPRCPR